MRAPGVPDRCGCFVRAAWKAARRSVETAPRNRSSSALCCADAADEYPRYVLVDESVRAFWSSPAAAAPETSAVATITAGARFIAKHPTLIRSPEGSRSKQERDAPALQAGARGSSAPEAGARGFSRATRGQAA